MMAYSFDFLPFFAALPGFSDSGMALRGRPFFQPGLGESLITSYAFIGYKASLDNGFSPALCKSFFTASLVFPLRSAISATVKNSSPFINIPNNIGFFTNKVTPSDNILHKCIVKIAKNAQYFHQKGCYVLTIFSLAVIICSMER